MYAEHESWRFVLCEKDEDMLVTNSRRQGAPVWSKQIGAILWPLVSRYPCKIDICRPHNWGKVAEQHSVSFEDVQGKEALYIYGRSTTSTRINSGLMKTDEEDNLYVVVQTSRFELGRRDPTNYLP
jgi:hypothetical protein